MYDTSKGVRVEVRGQNTNAGEGFVIEVDGYPLEARMEEAAVVLHALRTKGETAARQAYQRVLRARLRKAGIHVSPKKERTTRRRNMWRQLSLPQLRGQA